ncbi:MAG TPA: kynureninase [Opitutaceae bacterium]|nr:kynureninase [Opitutaceae bacterium]
MSASGPNSHACPAPVGAGTPADLDCADPLARFREEFFLPAGKIYLDGNSLGLLSRRAEASLLRVVDQWRTLGIDAWLKADPPWLALPETVAARLAPCVGAAADELCLTGQTTANLHQLLATLFQPEAASGRTVILGDALNFASDRYALQSHLRLRGLDPARHLRLVPSRDGRMLRLDELLDAFTDDVQLAVMPSVIFSSGQLLDVTTLTRKARERGIVIGWDLSHSIGAVPHALDRDGVDFAFWSNYKWLNGGPGAIGGLYLNRRHFGRSPGLAGWWGVRPERRFAMPEQHEAANGAAALHIGTPHILSLAPLLGALDLIAEAGGVEALRAKSLALTEFLLERIDAQLAPLGFVVASPRGHLARSGHVAVAHRDAWRICQALKAEGVVPDFREPDLIRLAPAPLTTSFAECAEAIDRMKGIVETRAYERYPAHASLVP